MNELEHLRSENETLLEYLKSANETAAGLQTMIERQQATIATQNQQIEDLRAVVVDTMNREAMYANRAAEFQAFYDATIAGQLGSLPPGVSQ